jgi:ribosomal protein L7/L12
VNIQEEEPEIVTTFRDLKKDTAPFIACIKAVRVVTGYGLREAKDFVNAMVMLKATIEIVDFEPHLQS